MSSAPLPTGLGLSYLNREKTHPRDALTKCKYPKWALDKIERYISNNQEENNWGNNQNGQSGDNNDNNNREPEGRDTTKDRYTKGHIVIPYIQGLGESTKNICQNYGIQTHFKGHTTIKNILVKPKDKDPSDKKSGGYLLVPMWGAHV